MLKAKPETKKQRKVRLELIKLMLDDGKKILKGYGLDIDKVKGINPYNYGESN